MTISEGIDELYRIARMAPMNGDSHDALKALHASIKDALVPQPEDAQSPDNVTPINAGRDAALAEASSR